MSLARFFKVLFGVTAAIVTGWLALIGLNIASILRALEGFIAQDGNRDAFWIMPEHLAASVQGGPALAIAAAVSGVVLSEVFRMRSLVLYAAVTGAMTIGVAATLSGTAAGNVGYAAAILAIAGFAAGAAYWLVAGRSA